MAKVAVLVPNQELELIAQPLTEEFPFLQVMEVKYIRTAYAVQRARELEQQVLDDMPFAFVADQQLIFVYSNKVKGVQINPTEYYLVTNTLSVEE